MWLLEPFTILWKRTRCSSSWVDQYKLSVSTSLLYYLTYTLLSIFLYTWTHNFEFGKPLWKPYIRDWTTMLKYYFIKTILFWLLDNPSETLFLASYSYIFVKTTSISKKVYFCLTHYSTPLIVRYLIFQSVIEILRLEVATIPVGLNAIKYYL